MGTNDFRFRKEKEVEQGWHSGLQILEADVDDVSTKVNQLEQKLTQVERFYSTANRKQKTILKGRSLLKQKDKEIAYLEKGHQDALRNEAAAFKRMGALIQEFSEIISDITQHKWAGPFLQPVDVVGLGLDDYYQVIEKPMDFGTIKTKMYSKDGSGYKNVREICADVRLIFKNAMEYNDEKDDVHLMAQSLLKRFEEKWLKLLPKVDEEERRRKEEEVKAQLDMQEAAHAKMVEELSVELDAVDMHLEQLRDMALQKCRKMTFEEKKMLSNALPRLEHEALNQAIYIVSQDDPNFQPIGEEVDIDLDNQSEATLLKLKIFVKDALLLQQKNCASLEENKNNNSNVNVNRTQANNNKRKREPSGAPARTSMKKSKPGPN